jgi:hypothetical protein
MLRLEELYSRLDPDDGQGESAIRQPGDFHQNFDFKPYLSLALFDPFRVIK